MKLTRRKALQVGLSSAAYYSLHATVPDWLARSANALIDCLPEDRILIVLQQEGGIDGLNTVIPVEDDAYFRARPQLAVPKGAALEIGDDLNRFHPRLPKLARWFREGHVAVLQNVGYLNPNQSHFTSTDYYMLGITPADPPTRQGWLWRFHGNACDGAGRPSSRDMVALGMGRVPESMFNPVPDEKYGTAVYSPPAVLDPARYTVKSIPVFHTDLMDAIARLNSLPETDGNMSFLQQTANTLDASIDDVETARKQSSLVEYPPDSKLGTGLQLASQIIRAGFKTRIFYVNQTGYDTHAGQAGAGNPHVGDHPRLLGEFDEAVDAFLTEMKQTGNLEKVLIMTFSEFGRRVEENGSLGTDHGAGNCSFIFGGKVRGGIYGGQPDLVDLDMGNLKHRIDFRSVYARVLRDWLSGPVIGTFGAKVFNDVIVDNLPHIPFLDLPANIAALEGGPAEKTAAIGIANELIKEAESRWNKNEFPLAVEAARRALAIRRSYLHPGNPDIAAVENMLRGARAASPRR